MSEKVSGFQITAPHFVAGGELKGATIERCAPIIKYMTGWTARKAKEYCDQQGWKIERTPNLTSGYRGGPIETEENKRILEETYGESIERWTEDGHAVVNGSIRPF